MHDARRGGRFLGHAAGRQAGAILLLLCVHCTYYFSLPWGLDRRGFIRHRLFSVPRSVHADVAQRTGEVLPIEQTDSIQDSSTFIIAIIPRHLQQIAIHTSIRSQPGPSPRPTPPCSMPHISTNQLQPSRTSIARGDTSTHGGTPHTGQQAHHPPQSPVGRGLCRAVESVPSMGGNRAVYNKGRTPHSTCYGGGGKQETSFAHHPVSHTHTPHCSRRYCIGAPASQQVEGRGGITLPTTTRHTSTQHAHSDAQAFQNIYTNCCTSSRTIHAA